ncbi:hypothetical protein AYI69_g670 [Smittium culicis]|uniref:Uncharacterized protein n=1 Tax=Smittium culicis TaxID=133412 RepID=A0A1R1YSF1_9FUNG|nr:hypothetical protein AYI69_g670 [Smittium culicis]
MDDIASNIPPSKNTSHVDINQSTDDFSSSLVNDSMPNNSSQVLNYSLEIEAQKLKKFSSENTETNTEIYDMSNFSNSYLDNQLNSNTDYSLDTHSEVQANSYKAHSPQLQDIELNNQIISTPSIIESKTPENVFTPDGSIGIISSIVQSIPIVLPHFNSSETNVYSKNSTLSKTPDISIEKSSINDGSIPSSEINSTSLVSPVEMPSTEFNKELTPVPVNVKVIGEMDDSSASKNSTPSIKRTKGLTSPNSPKGPNDSPPKKRSVGRPKKANLDSNDRLIISPTPPSLKKLKSLPVSISPSPTLSKSSLQDQENPINPGAVQNSPNLLATKDGHSSVLATSNPSLPNQSIISDLSASLEGSLQQSSHTSITGTSTPKILSFSHQNQTLVDASKSDLNGNSFRCQDVSEPQSESSNTSLTIDNYLKNDSIPAISTQKSEDINFNNESKNLGVSLEIRPSHDTDASSNITPKKRVGRPPKTNLPVGSVTPAKKSVGRPKKVLDNPTPSSDSNSINAAISGSTNGSVDNSTSTISTPQSNGKVKKPVGRPKNPPKDPSAPKFINHLSGSNALDKPLAANALPSSEKKKVGRPKKVPESSISASVIQFSQQYSPVNQSVDLSSSVPSSLSPSNLQIKIKKSPGRPRKSLGETNSSETKIKNSTTLKPISPAVNPINGGFSTTSGIPFPIYNPVSGSPMNMVKPIAPQPSSQPGADFKGHESPDQHDDTNLKNSAKKQKKSPGRPSTKLPKVTSANMPQLLPHNDFAKFNPAFSLSQARYNAGNVTSSSKLDLETQTGRNTNVLASLAPVGMGSSVTYPSINASDPNSNSDKIQNNSSSGLNDNQDTLAVKKSAGRPPKKQIVSVAENGSIPAQESNSPASTINASNPEFNTSDSSKAGLFNEISSAQAPKKTPGRPKKNPEQLAPSDTSNVTTVNNEGESYSASLKGLALNTDLTPVKKPVGRPRKLVSATEVKVKKPVGRPRKSLEGIVMTPKKSVGRPSKSSLVDSNKDYFKSIFARYKNSDRVPLMNLSSGAEYHTNPMLSNISPVKKSVGRPKKIKSEVLSDISPSYKKSIQHDPLNPTALATQGDGVGVPSLTQATDASPSPQYSMPVANVSLDSDNLSTPKRKVGRPKKQPSTNSDSSNASHLSATPKRSVGRPRKIQPTNMSAEFYRNSNTDMPQGVPDINQLSDGPYKQNISLAMLEHSQSTTKRPRTSSTTNGSEPSSTSKITGKRPVGRPRKSEVSEDKIRLPGTSPSVTSSNNEANPLNVEMSLHDDESLREADAIASFARSKKKVLDISGAQSSDGIVNGDNGNSRLSEDLEYFSGIKKDNNKTFTPTHSGKRAQRTILDLWSTPTKRKIKSVINTTVSPNSAKQIIVDVSPSSKLVMNDKNANSSKKVPLIDSIAKPKGSKNAFSFTKALLKVAANKESNEEPNDSSDIDSGNTSASGFHILEDDGGGSDSDFVADHNAPLEIPDIASGSTAQLKKSQSLNTSYGTNEESDVSDSFIDEIISRSSTSKKGSRGKVKKEVSKSNMKNIPGRLADYSTMSKSPSYNEGSAEFIDLLDGRVANADFLLELRPEFLSRVWIYRLNRLKCTNKLFIGKSQMHVVSDIPLMRVGSSDFSWKIVSSLCSWKTDKKVSIVENGEQGLAIKKLSIDATDYTKWKSVEESQVSSFYNIDNQPIEVSFTNSESFPTSPKKKANIGRPSLASKSVSSEKSLKIEKIGSDDLVDDKVYKIDSFESICTENGSISVANSEMCLMALDWCPQTVGPICYLAAGGMKNSSSFQYYHGKKASRVLCESEKSTIQLWEYNKDNGDLQVCLFICHDKGLIINLSWCPLHPADNYDDYKFLEEYSDHVFTTKDVDSIKKKYPSKTFNNSYKKYISDPSRKKNAKVSKSEFSFYDAEKHSFIGLLAVVFSNGKAGVYAIPNPNLVHKKESASNSRPNFDKPSYQNTPNICLPKPILEMSMVNTTINKVIWVGSDRVISIGFDGTIAIWSLSKGIEQRMDIHADFSKPSVELTHLNSDDENDLEDHSNNQLIDVPILHSSMCLNGVIQASLFPPNILCNFSVEAKRQMYSGKTFEQIEGQKSRVNGYIAHFSLDDIILCTGGVTGELYLHKMVYPNFITSTLSKMVVWRNAITFTQSGDSLVYVDISSNIKFTNTSNFNYVRSEFFSLLKKVFWEMKTKESLAEKGGRKKAISIEDVISSLDNVYKFGDEKENNEKNNKRIKRVGCFGINIINGENELTSEFNTGLEGEIFESLDEIKKSLGENNLPYFLQFFEGFIECFATSIKATQREKASNLGPETISKTPKKAVKDIPWSDGKIKMDDISTDVAEIIQSIKEANIDDIIRAGENEKIDGDERDMFGIVIADHRSTVCSISSSLCHSFLASSATNGSVIIEEISKRPFTHSSKRNTNLSFYLYTLSKDPETGVYSYKNDKSVYSGPKKVSDVEVSPPIQTYIYSTAWHPAIGHGHLLASGSHSGLLRVDSLNKR